MGWNKTGTSSCTNTEWGTTGLGNGLSGNVSQEIHPLQEGAKSILGDVNKHRT